MATAKGKSAFAFVKDFLERHPSSTFAEVAEAGAAKGHKIWPIVYGRAQLLLGQAGPKSAKSKKKAAGKKTAKRPVGRPRKSAAEASTSTGRRGPGRPRKSATSASAPAGRRGPGRPRKSELSGGAADAVQSLIAHVRELEAERDDLRAKLDEVRSVIGNA